jgi:membrane protein
MFLMLWLYFCMYILLIGAEINAYFEDRFRRMRMRYLINRESYKKHRREERERREQEKMV